MTMRKEKPAMRLRATSRAEKAIQAAYVLASHEGVSLAQSQHLLMALVQEPGSFSTRLLGELGVSPQDLVLGLAQVESERGGFPYAEAEAMRTTPGQTRIAAADPSEQAWAHNRAALLDPARDAAQRLGDTQVGTEHLLLGLLREEEAAGQALLHLGVTWERAQAALSVLPRGNTPLTEDRPAG